MDPIEKIYPTIEQLSLINKCVSCPECGSIFATDSTLHFHIVKTHRRAPLSPKSARIYYCPIATCTYHTSAHFKQFKFIKQHYLKVHAERGHLCALCNKGFATEAYRDRHSEYCNILFKCCECEMVYGCYETLKTHSRRKKHRILEKTAYRGAPVALRTEDPLDTTDLAHNWRFILPKPSLLERSSQTERQDPTVQTTQQTQTLSLKMERFSAQTQTTGGKALRQEANTQTRPEDEEDLLAEKLSSGTQTPLEGIYSASTSTHDSIHTDTSDLLSFGDFFNCNMETQTDFIEEFNKYCDDYSNMYTQTYEDLLGDIDMSNNHTQTVLDDVLKSVESQTVLSQSKKLAWGCNIETQTDLEFKQIFEEINA